MTYTYTYSDFMLTNGIAVSILACKYIFYMRNCGTSQDVEPYTKVYLGLGGNHEVFRREKTKNTISYYSVYFNMHHYTKHFLDDGNTFKANLISHS